MSHGIQVMMQACDELGISYRQIGSNEAILSVSFGDSTHLMLNNAFGLNTDAQSKLSADKYYLYELLSSTVSMPFTRSYIDPHATDHFTAFTTFQSFEEILNDINKHFSQPLIVKRNSGTQGENVYLCDSDQEILKAMQAIYSKKQIEYDHVLLAETYIKPKREFRVMILEGKVELVYHKDNTSAKFQGNLSPLHWEHATSHVVDEPELISRIQSMVDCIYLEFPIVYAGLDVIESEDDQLCLIEINSTPQFGRFLHENTADYFKQIFVKALTVLQKRYTH